jgi:peptide/nickel transport system substrate-binding protein
LENHYNKGNAMERKAATASNWWDKLGKPQYGGEMVIRSTTNLANFDPYYSDHITQIYTAWMEKLYAEDWLLDPVIFDYKILPPAQYLKGHLAESWEFTDPNTYIVHLRKGIHWQNIPPVNGREFTADDVVYHYHRLYGLGSGFTKPAQYHSTVTAYRSLLSVTAVDRYTVVFKWKTPNPEFIMETMITIHSPTASIEAREAVEKWGDLKDWHHAIGTGPFILKDFVSGSSATLVKNPDYWGYDERYSQNKLPYIDTLKILIIPDEEAAMAAMRAGNLDVTDRVSFRQAQAMQKTNPEILQIGYPDSATSLDPRNDRPPFNDIRVRKALQSAIDLPTIAKSYYQGSVLPYPCSISSNYMKGWGFPYNDWPQDLKDEYAYNPQAAKQLLADAGYPGGFKTNIVAANTADLDLLKIVKSYFAQVGIDMEIRLMEPAALIAFTQTDQKHDQLAYGGSLGSGHEPLRQLTRFQTGSSGNPQLKVSDPVFDAFYPGALAATGVDEIKRIFRDANEYVARKHFAISLLQPMRYALYQPWLKGYSGQFGSISWSPQSLSFYAARFWIDQTLKKSMRH